MALVDNILVRVLPTGETHWGQVNILPAGEENEWGISHTDVVSVGPLNNETFPMGLVSLKSGLTECPNGAENHYE